jgi:RNA polymerase sigma factor (sigma-70 family)
MISDSQLLQDYARAKTQDAFTELVRRHLNLVYSAALRQVRSPQLAEEISQSVFADLARAAHKLKPDTILTAWLYQVTRRTAIDVVRRESRRQARERLAVEMAAMNTAANWTHIEPLLDDAMEALDETDRAAILLRYFENKSLREVGQSLGTSDDAAQKRVSRAVERMREFFSKRGVVMGASALVLLISAHAVQAAPIALAATISTAAILAGTTVHTSTAIVTKAITVTLFQKAVVTATVTVLAGASVYKAHQATQLREQVQTLQQQQAPLAAEVQQLQQQRDEASNQVAALTEEVARANNNDFELLKLRGEVGALRRQLSQYSDTPQRLQSKPSENPTASAEAAARKQQVQAQNAFVAQIAAAIAQGDPNALQQLDQFAKSQSEFYRTNSAGLQGDERSAVWSDAFGGIYAAFDSLSNEAVKGNAHAAEAIKRAVHLTSLQGAAITGLGKLAGNGDEEALQVLLNPDKNGLLLSSTVNALGPAADSGNQQAIAALAAVLADEKKRPLWSMASESLQQAALNGNPTAIAALKSMPQHQ